MQHGRKGKWLLAFTAVLMGVGSFQAPANAESAAGKLPVELLMAQATGMNGQPALSKQIDVAAKSAPKPAIEAKQTGEDRAALMARLEKLEKKVRKLKKHLKRQVKKRRIEARQCKTKISALEQKIKSCKARPSISNGDFHLEQKRFREVRRDLNSILNDLDAMLAGR